MRVYTVLQPPTPPGEVAEPTSFVFIKEGFCWPALFVAELWLLCRRMWLVFLAYLAVAMVLTGLDGAFGGPLPWIFLTLAHLLFAFEANELRRWTLERRGYRQIGVVAGGYLRDAELRFFLAWKPEAPSPTKPEPAKPSNPTMGPPAADFGDVVGLFPAPEGGG